MNLHELTSNKLIKPKEKTETLSRWLIDHPEKIDELITFADSSKDPVKATCIESIEFATQSKPGVLNKEGFKFVCKSLTEKAPRIKWESAKVIANTCAQFPKQLDVAINNLLANTEHTGTVVRWSAAYALAEIMLLRTTHNKLLLPALKAVSEREEKTSIKKIYLAAFTKLNSKK